MSALPAAASLASRIPWGRVASYGINSLFALSALSGLEEKGEQALDWDVWGNKKRARILADLAGNSAVESDARLGEQVFAQKDLGSRLRSIGTPTSYHNPVDQVLMEPELEGLVQRNRSELGGMAQREAAISSFDRVLMNLGFINAV